MLTSAAASAVLCTAVAGWTVAASAADLGEPTQETLEQAAAVREWTFTVTPYLWAAGLEGKAGVFGFPPQDVDLSFSDVLENLDIALMMMGEARYDRWSVGFDLLYSDLGASVGAPDGISADSIDVSSTLLIATLVGGYAVVSEPGAHLDVFAGARLVSSETSFDFNGRDLDGLSRSDSATWVDPVVGVKGRFDIPDTRFFMVGWGLVGGFGVGSEFTWDAMASVGYRFTDTFELTAGYRGLGVDYDEDGYVFDVTQHGPIIGASIRF